MEQKRAYPIILKKDPTGYYVQIPDFDVGTQGDTIAEAMAMARDAIGLMGIDLEDDHKEIPAPYSQPFTSEKDDIVTLVDVDFSEYRRKMENRTIRKNCTIPYWMSIEADKAGVNYSRLLQDAICNVLGLSKTAV